MNFLTYLRPKTLEEAFALLNQCKKEKKPVLISAGGTDVVPHLKQHPLSRPTALVSLGGLQKKLRGIRIKNKKSLEIGSLTTLAELSESALIRSCSPTLAPTLAIVARQIASPQIQNRATVGGNLLVDTRCVYFNQSTQNRLVHSACFKAGGACCHLIPNARRGGRLPLCHARFVSDLAPLFLLLNAKLVLKSQNQTRTVSLRDFYRPDGIGRNQLKPTEILTQIEIPLPAPQKMHYEKLRIRNAIDFASLGVAVSFSATHRVQIALTGTQTHPLFFEWDVRQFKSKEEFLKQAVARLTREAQPLKQDFFQPSYRRKMIGVFVERGLQKLGFVL